MSPLVQRPRTGGAQRSGSTAGDQHWSMVAFESFSTGVVAVLLVCVALLAIVGLYALIVWPLTFWELAMEAEQFSGLASLVMWSVFAGGSLAGFWCFSGMAFRPKAKKAAANGVRMTANVRAIRR